MQHFSMLAIGCRRTDLCMSVQGLGLIHLWLCKIGKPGTVTGYLVIDQNLDVSDTFAGVKAQLNAIGPIQSVTLHRGKLHC